MTTQIYTPVELFKDAVDMQDMDRAMQLNWNTYQESERILKRLKVLRELAEANKELLGEKYQRTITTVNRAILEREMDLDSHSESINLMRFIQGPTKQNGGLN